MEPLVTAIITTYHRSNGLLKRSINSVLDQTYKNIELIIVDDNGMESEYHNKVKELISEYYTDRNITLIHHEKNQGVQRARNNGIKNANGKFIAFLDDDDEWLPKKIEKQIKLFKGKNNENVALVYGGFIRVKVDNYQQIESRVINAPKYSSENTFRELLRINFIGSTSVPLLRKDSVNEVGGFDESMPASQDLELWLRLARKFQIRCVEGPVIRYHIHSGERISTDFAKKEIAIRKILNKYPSFFEKDRFAYGTKMRSLGNLLLYQKEFKEGRSYLIKSIKIFRDYKNIIISSLFFIRSYWLQTKFFLRDR